MFVQVHSLGELLSVSHGTMYSRNPLKKAEGGSQGGEPIIGSLHGFALRGWLVADLLSLFIFFAFFSPTASAG